MYSFAIVGAGILGLATCLKIRERFPDASIVVLEKERDFAAHQSSHNSGVIHSGIYYKPGSQKSRFARAASQSMTKFCQEHDVNHRICGKLIVARNNDELKRLDISYDNGRQSGLNVEKLSSEEVRGYEPHARVHGGLFVPEAGIVDYKDVCRKLVDRLTHQGVEFKYCEEVRALKEEQGHLGIVTQKAFHKAGMLINCSGLHSDSVALMQGLTEARRRFQVVPFRGDFYTLKESRAHLVKGLIYPVPNPKYPFLGVHLGRLIGGKVEVGPNAALNFSREGYGRTVVPRELARTLVFPGFWKMAGNYWKEGAAEIWRSYNKQAFVKAAQRYIPDIQLDDLDAAHAGIRAQTLSRSGRMLDDFEVLLGYRSIHLINAPSPAATCAFEIAKYILDKVAQHRDTNAVSVANHSN